MLERTEGNSPRVETLRGAVPIITEKIKPEDEDYKGKKRALKKLAKDLELVREAIELLSKQGEFKGIKIPRPTIRRHSNEEMFCLDLLIPPSEDVDYGPIVSAIKSKFHELKTRKQVEEAGRRRKERFKRLLDELREQQS